MTVIYHVLLQEENGKISIIRTFNNNIDKGSIAKETSQIKESCSCFNWSKPGASKKIGKFLFALLNGSKKLLECAIISSNEQGEMLQLSIEEKGSIPYLPFELLYKSEFLVLSKVHLVRCTSDLDYYCETPLPWEKLSEEIFEDKQKKYHEAVVKYFQEVLTGDTYNPRYSLELINHALLCNMDEAALEEGSRLLSFLRVILFYEAALSEGMYIFSHISEIGRTEKSCMFLSELGMLLHDVGDYKQAAECHERALKIGKEIYGESHSNVAAMLNNLGSVWYSLEEPKMALEYFEKALEIRKEIYGERHPDVAIGFHNLGGAWDSLGDHKKAIEYSEKALEIDRETYGENHHIIARDFSNLGGAWYSLGDHKKAIKYFERALLINKKTYGENHYIIARDFSNLGGAWYSLGDHKKAIKYFEKALLIDREIYGEDHPSVARDFHNLGGAWYSLGDHKKAIEYVQKTYRIHKRAYGDQHPITRSAKEALEFLEDQNK